MLKRVVCLMHCLPNDKLFLQQRKLDANRHILTYLNRNDNFHLGQRDQK